MDDDRNGTGSSDSSLHRATESQKRQIMLK